MPYLLQVDFEMDEHFRNKMFENFKELAKIINSEPGMIWKICLPKHMNLNSVM